MNYIKCVPAGEEGKHTVYRVFLPNVSTYVGEVRWYDKAERYVFCMGQVAHLWLDSRCLRLIAEFCEQKTAERTLVV